MGTGWSVNGARKVSLLICALAVVPVFLAPVAGNVWLAVVIIGIAGSAHQGWSANLFTTTSDTFPKEAVGSVTGLGGMAGAVGSMVFAPITGYILQLTGSYLPLFIISGTAYLIALGVMQILVPRMEPVVISAVQPLPLERIHE